jgi:hypothetical protein
MRTFHFFATHIHLDKKKKRASFPNGISRGAKFANFAWIPKVVIVH